MYIKREITDRLRQLVTQFPVIYLMGPRQSGKSTLLKHAFPTYTYVSLEDIDIRQFALEDPRQFLELHGDHVIIDEAQRAPDLFSYIQTRVDASGKTGTYLLSGSQNFMMMNNISQSLAGRVGILKLLPFAMSEYKQSEYITKTDKWLFYGGYPRIISDKIAPDDYFPSYILTYLERDIREETGVKDLGRFRNFIKVCASRVGTPINFSDIGKELATDSRTISNWLSVLEESFITFRLQPWYRNFGKRCTKTPKLYFHDTGLLCALLGMENHEELTRHPMRGNVFENAIISEFAKTRYNAGKEPRQYFWREAYDREKEVDLVIDRPNVPDLIEIKSAQTANTKFTKNIRLLSENTDFDETRKIVVYDGPDSMRIAETEFVNWRNLRRVTEQ